MFSAPPDAYTARPDALTTPDAFIARPDDRGSVPPVVDPESPPASTVFVTPGISDAGVQTESFPPPPPPPPAVEVEPDSFSFNELQSVQFAATPAPSPVSPASDTVHINGSDFLPAPAAPDESDYEPVFADDAGQQFNSAASMATEILSVAPDAVPAEIAEAPQSELISKDVTLIARGRRKRFRLH